MGQIKGKISMINSEWLDKIDQSSDRSMTINIRLGSKYIYERIMSMLVFGYDCCDE
jgi:hypothetical protein